MTSRRDRAPRVPVGAVTAEALTYAGARLETALRAVWAPVLILMAWQAMIELPAGGIARDALTGAGFGRRRTDILLSVSSLLFALVPLALTASYMAPLVLDAAGRRALPHRTVPNKIGSAELRWIAGSVAGLGGLFLLARAPVLTGLAGLDRLARHARAAEVATFEDGSLHASEVVPAYSEGLRSWLSGGPLDVPGIGAVPLPTGAPLILQALGLVLLAYVWLRLFALPAMLTAGGGARRALRGALDASAGWNLTRLAAIAALTGAANLALLWMLGWVPVLIGMGLNAAYPFLAGYAAFGAEGAEGAGGAVAPWVRASLTLVGQGTGIAVTVLTVAVAAAVNAGALGAIVRRVAPD